MWLVMDKGKIDIGLLDNTKRPDTPSLWYTCLQEEVEHCVSLGRPHITFDDVNERVIAISSKITDWRVKDE